MKTFRTVTPQEWEANVFRSIGEQWMLICVEQGDQVNLMTASWGGMGVLWSVPVAYTFIRPQRHTFGMIEQAQAYSLLFLGEEYRKQLQLCGSKSGRDIDKIAECGFTVAYENDVPYVRQADTAVFCRKLYRQDLSEAAFLERRWIDAHYPNRDFHRLYVGEITTILTTA